MKTAIIGSGVAGLSAAIRLALQGHLVEVFESNSYPGGKLSQFEQDGFRFDAGPSLFTMPQLVDELFSLAGLNPSNHFQYQRLGEICRYFYEDGTRFTAWADTSRFANEVSEKTGEPVQNILKALKKSEQYYNLIGILFLYKSLHKASTFLNWTAGKAVLQIPFLGIFTTMHKANRKQFTSEKVVQLFDRYATYNGSDPYQTPGLLNMIPHFEYGFGAWFPVKGMVSITNRLVWLAEYCGVKFHFSSPVQEILVENGKVKGILVKNEKQAFDLVISNADMVSTYRKLLPNEKHPNRLLNQPKSSSALIFYWGINAEFPELGLHNILFSANYKSEFEAIFKQKTIGPDPTIYINITSKYKPDDAPANCENWFVMINVPNNHGQDWDLLISKAREAIIEKASRLLGRPITPLIVSEQILDPRSIESRTSSFQGALYGNSSNNRFAAFLRHANFSPYIDGLYFCGGSVHPGGGIPLALLSGKITANLIAEKCKK